MFRAVFSLMADTTMCGHKLKMKIVKKCLVIKLQGKVMAWQILPPSFSIFVMFFIVIINTHKGLQRKTYRVI